MESVPASKQQSPLIGLNSRKLIRYIFDSNEPEQTVRQIPAQSLYLAIKEQGLESSDDLIELMSVPQCRLLLDFDCWQQDQLNEASLWQWLALTDTTDDLYLLKKVLQSIDLRIVSLLIARHAQVQVHEEPSDIPPGESYYTPDKGYTWINITCQDPNQHFLLGRLLALIFDTDTKLFYQLLAIPSVATNSQLEEEAYTDRCKRLEATGIPSHERAWEITTPASPATIAKALTEATDPPFISNIKPVTPLVHQPHALQPLDSVLAEADPESAESALTQVMNAAIIRWNVNLSDPEAIQLIAHKVKGAINIGLELVRRQSQREVLECYRILGIELLMRAALHRLDRLRKKAISCSESQTPKTLNANLWLLLLAGLRQPFPEKPISFGIDGSFTSKDGKEIAGGYEPITTLADLENLETLLGESS